MRAGPDAASVARAAPEKTTPLRVAQALTMQAKRGGVGVGGKRKGLRLWLLTPVCVPPTRTSSVASQPKDSSS
jgi:hypothetical protein